MTEPRLDVAALYKSLDAKRSSRKISWRQLAKEARVSPSTLTRMAQGLRPDVDAFARLVSWLGVSADRFLGHGETREAKEEEPIAMISTLLRARKNLAPETARALEEIVRIAFQALTEEQRKRR